MDKQRSSPQGQPRDNGSIGGNARPSTAPADVANDEPSVFVLCNKDAEEIETPVFQAGDDGEEEAIALFTSRDKAEAYLAATASGESEEVRSLGVDELAQWLADAMEDGIHYLTVDPRYERQRDNDDQQVLALQEVEKESLDGVVQEIMQLARQQPPSRPQK